MPNDPPGAALSIIQFPDMMHARTLNVEPLVGSQLWHTEEAERICRVHSVFISRVCIQKSVTIRY